MVRDPESDEASNHVLNPGKEKSHSGKGNNGLNRRSYLKLLAASTVSAATITAGTDVVQATDHHYGEGGYGQGAYGGSDFAVVTQDPTAVDTTSVTLEGELSNLDGETSADCYFEWRQTGVSSWNTTTTQTLNETGTFGDSLSGIDEDTEYEYRALADGSDGVSDTGTTVSFVTDSSESLPIINRFSVSEAGRPDPHAEITVVWDVTDPDKDLASINIEMTNSIKGQTRTVSGSHASDVDSFSIKQGDGQTFDVSFTLTDTAGNSVTETKSVTA